MSLTSSQISQTVYYASAAFYTAGTNVNPWYAGESPPLSWSLTSNPSTVVAKQEQKIIMLDAKVLELQQQVIALKAKLKKKTIEEKEIAEVLAVTKRVIDL